MALTATCALGTASLGGPAGAATAPAVCGLPPGGSDPLYQEEEASLGTDHACLFDPITERWIRQPDSPLGRYYPTTTKPGDGRVVIVAGDQVNGAKNPNVELFTPPLAGTEVGTLAVVGPAHPSSFYPRQWCCRTAPS